jgi:probable HAF family extracellular repeat protein
MDINDSGQIAGYTQNLQTSTLTYEAGYWNGTAFQDLGFLPGGRYSYADAINNNGQMVGWGDDGKGNTYALLWDGGHLSNLNDYLDANSKKNGWILVDANDISNTGFVVGDAMNAYTHAYHAYVLSINDGPVNGGPIPVPEPRTYAMLIMGLGLLGYLKTSKSKTQS